MDKLQADKIICEYTQKIFGFALSKTSSIDRAEELASRITIEVYSSLLRSDNITSIAAYIWRIAMNVRARYIDEEMGSPILSIDELELADDSDPIDSVIDSETKAKLRLEIAYLSKLRRRILILHYYKGMKLKSIAEKLSIPEGTVKWQLSAAKNELREGFTKMRAIGTLGIEPITLTNLSHDGMPGKLGATEHFLQNRLTQNIIWAAYKTPRTINEIADELGVNPIFLEDEIEALEEYGFLDRIGERLRSNILIDDPTPELDIKVCELYKKYSKKLAETYPMRVFEAAKALDRSKLYIPGNDQTLLDWAFMALSLRSRINIAFDNSAYQKFMVPRKDGGSYIAFATVDKSYELPFDMCKYSCCGPMRRGSCKYPIYSWQLTTYYDSRKLDWSENRYENYEYLYEFYTGRIQKTTDNIEKYTRLRDIGYLTESDEINLIVFDHNGRSFDDTDIAKLLPDPNENEKALILELSEKLCDLLVPRYPENMQSIAKLYNSNPKLTPFMLEELVQSESLSLPSPLRAPGLCTLVFADKLPK